MTPTVPRVPVGETVTLTLAHGRLSVSHPRRCRYRVFTITTEGDVGTLYYLRSLAEVEILANEFEARRTS